MKILKLLQRTWLPVSIVALGTLLRLLHLGVPSFRADTMIALDLCRAPHGAWTIFFHWMKIMGKSAQMPFPWALTRLFIDLFHLEPTAFAVRLPNAAFGILTVLALYCLGRQLAGRRFGAGLALLLAVNPFHIQLSQEAYFYSPMLLGVTIQGWATLWAWRHRRLSQPFPLRFHLLTLTGFFLMTYSHVSGWWLGIPCCAFLTATLGWRARRDKKLARDLWIWLVPAGLIALPLLFFDWGLPYFIDESLSTEGKEHVKHLFGERQTPLYSFMWLFMKSAAWGATPIRVLLLAIVSLLSLLTAMAGAWWKRFRKVSLLAAWLLVGFGIYALSLISTETYYAQRHVAFLQPFLLALLAYGAWHISGWPWVRRLIRQPVLRRLPAYVLLLAAVGLSLAPAWLSTQVTGKPIPFKQIAQWCDDNLPHHTMVLVERWFDPWNELRIHNATNIFFAFTVPSEPPDVFAQNNWPATAVQFFEQFPDAAFLEYSNSDRARLGVVSNVPFARQMVFTNEAGIRLAQLGTAFREDFYDPATNRLISTIFYNTREDVLANARARGQSTLILYGPEWGYTKLWQQFHDFRNWRVMEDQASLEVHNLTDSNLTATVYINGMAVNGSKRVSFENLSQADYYSLTLATWRIENVPLSPGLNRFTISDKFYRQSHIPLLVDQVSLEVQPSENP